MNPRLRARPLPLWTALSTILAAACADEPRAPAIAVAQQGILGGSQSPAGAFPGVVWLDVGCTGVLVAPDTVLYAGHCGTAVQHVWLGDALELELLPEEGRTNLLAGASQHASPVHCEAHSGTKIGDPSDLAFCRLAEPLLDRSLLPTTLAQCEREALQVGQQVTLVGFGIDPSTDLAGTKKVVRAPLAEVGTVLAAGAETGGSCAGDSGGPLFVRTDDLNSAWRGEWRLAGILSSGHLTERCGLGRYVDVATELAWIESSTQRDLSPCTDAAGDWAPTPRCAAPALDDSGLPGAAVLASSTCGEPFTGSDDSAGAPLIQDVRVERGFRDDVTPALHVEPTVLDSGSGIAEVFVEFLAADGGALEEAFSETPPFDLWSSGLAARARSVTVTVNDYAGHSVSESRSVPPARESSCALPYEPLASGVAARLWCCLLGAAAIWRRRANASRQLNLIARRRPIASRRSRRAHGALGRRPGAG